MAIQTISRIQNRRGLYADLPASLAEGEFGWCLDTRQLFIGNSDGYGGNTEVLTEYSQNTDIISTVYNNNGLQLAAAKPRTLGNKLNDIVSVKDFGAVGNGLVNDAPAINAAITSLLKNYPNSGTTVPCIHLPAGKYLINSTILLYPYLNLLGDSDGATTILCNDQQLMFMMQTADSLGQTGANIGLNNAALPSRIRLQDLVINTNGFHMNAVQLVRYNHIRFERVTFQGGWTQGQGLLQDSAVTLKSFGTAINTYDAQFIDCQFKGFTVGITADDPVTYTAVARSVFRNNYRGMAFGVTPVSGGPSYTSVSQSYFYALENYNIMVGDDSTNPGVLSTSNSFNSDGRNLGGYHIYWGNNSTLNSSIGDVFDILPAINNNGVNNIILDAQIPPLGTAPSRTTIMITTGSIAPGSNVTVNATGFKGYNLYSIQTNQPAWVAIYSSAASLVADAGRPIHTDPTSGSGVIAEAINNIGTIKLFTPAAIGFSSESPPTDIIPIKVTNTAAGAAVITVTLTLLQTES